MYTRTVYVVFRIYSMYVHVCMYVCMCVHMCTYDSPGLSCHCTGLVKEALTDTSTVSIGITLIAPVEVDIVAVLLSSHDQFSEGFVVTDKVLQYL